MKLPIVLVSINHNQSPISNYNKKLPANNVGFIGE